MRKFIGASLIIPICILASGCSITDFALSTPECDHFYDYQRKTFVQQISKEKLKQLSDSCLKSRDRFSGLK